MWEMGKVGRWVVQRGRYFMAQQPRTILWFQGRWGDGGVWDIVLAISLIMSSASLSSYKGVGKISNCLRHCFAPLCPRVARFLPNLGMPSILEDPSILALIRWAL